MSNKLKDRLLSKTSGLAPAGDNIDPQSIPRRPTGTSMPAQLGAFRQEAQRYLVRIEELERQLEQANDAAGILEIPLDKIRIIEGRRKFMSPQKYAELRENLRHNRLMHPIVVSAAPDGFYELISGHHRYDAYQEIGFDSIRATVDVGAKDANEAYIGAFYANLFQSDLTDFEKFVGFEEIRRLYPEMTQASISEQSGIDESTLSRLMSFKQLPEKVLGHLKAQPSIIGSNTAAKLSMLSRQGHEGAVIEAVDLLARGEIDQTRALTLAAKKSRPSDDKQTPIVSAVKNGRTVLFNVRSAGNVVRVESKTASDTQRIHDAIVQALSTLAEDTKDQ